ncbi:IS200/IS605 family transposase [Arthrobacter sp. MYb227]|uniref:IS200/IS605 family transposase n=1 Tax=Arthrobacter sp. MYb227 TaxID=1848601 RepID=UPI000CFE18E4|nr:IS200/IS605 family transposase [Arthrobacter sp. MYb227]PQZ93496.1 IS200/IS605 family transposase [Arthrobacter sp. MYb227]
MSLETLRRNKNTTYRCWYHVVWCPKYRRPVITSNDPAANNPPIAGDPGPVDERLVEIIQEVASEAGAMIEESETMPDHIHMLVSVDPQYGIAKFIRNCKGRSSRTLRQEFPSLKRRLPTLWTNSYFVSTIGGAPQSIIKQYIADQRQV